MLRKLSHALIVFVAVYAIGMLIAALLGVHPTQTEKLAVTLITMLGLSLVMIVSGPDL